MTSTTDWRSLIVDHEQLNPLSLKPHPKNFYTHPMQQRKVVNAAIDDIGYIDEVVMNRRTGHTLNGHLRVELAIGNGETTIPVTVLECDEETENKILLFFDRIGEQAKVQGDKVQTLADAIEPQSDELQNMLDEWVATFEKFNRPKAAAPAPASVAAAPAPAPVAAAPAPAADPVAPESVQAAPAPVAAAAAAALEPILSTPEPIAAASVAAEPVVAPEPVQSAPEPVAAAPVAAEPVAAQEAAPAALEPVAAPAPAAPEPMAAPRDNFEAAIVEDGGTVITPVAPPVVKVEKPIVVKVGEYSQEFPAEVFNAWWALFRADVGGDYATICQAIRDRLQMPADPR